MDHQIDVAFWWDDSYHDRVPALRGLLRGCVVFSHLADVGTIHLAGMSVLPARSSHPILQVVLYDLLVALILILTHLPFRRPSCGTSPDRA